MKKNKMLEYDGVEATAEQVMEALDRCSNPVAPNNTCEKCPLFKILLFDKDCGYILPGLALEALKLTIEE